MAILLYAGLSISCGSVGDAQRGQLIEDVVGPPLSEAAYRASIENEFRIKEDFIQECMTKNGFEYFAWTGEGILPGYSAGIGSDSREFAEEYGFGISTVNSVPSTENPNIAIRAGLSEVEQAAYDEALYGESPGGDFAVIEVGEDATDTSSCEQHAYDAFRPDITLPPENVMNSYYSLMEEIDERVASDPLVREATTSAVECFKAEGRALTEELTPIESFLEAAQAMSGLDDVSLATMIRSASEESTIASVQKLEVSYALAWWDCFEPVNAVSKGVREEVEAEVVAANYSTFLAAREGLRRNSPIADPTYEPSYEPSYEP